MSQELIHVYLMPGMAASPSIFDFIELPKPQFELHKLQWQIPAPKETLKHYAKRMAAYVRHDNCVLIGVSFGGILVQEMKIFLLVKKVIIISSVKTKYELPRRFQFGRYTKAYKLIPTQLISKIKTFEKLNFGSTISKRIKLYSKYLDVSDKTYLNWSLKQIVYWQRETSDPEIIHIHGDKDMAFPIKYIKDCLVVKGGTHVMIINRYKWFNENLPKLILKP